MKQCYKCKEWKEESEFNKDKNRKDGLNNWCKKCKNASARKCYAENNPADNTNKLLWKRFGITLEEYNQMFIKQKGCCGICERHQSEFKKALDVDHEHVEGYNKMPPEEKRKYVRGLLCNSCNRGIGLLYENKEIFLKSMKYLNIQTIEEILKDWLVGNN